jgi:hypothetical protein
MLKSLKSDKPESFSRQIKQTGSLRSVATNFPTNQFFLRPWGGKDRQFYCQKISGIEFHMNCFDYKLAFAPLLTFLVFYAGTADAFGQVKDAQPRQTESLGSEIATPAELLGDTPGNRSTLAPLLGSPQAIAIPASDPVPRPANAGVSPTDADASAAEIAVPSLNEAAAPQREQRMAPNTKSEDYWKPVPGKAETVEYEKLDAETSRDLFNAESVRKLRKPMREIRIVAEDDADAPRNLASRFMVKEPVLKIVAAGISPPRPDRYPIIFKHRPLYYEQPLLERCGRGCGIAQNTISAGQFCLNTFILPYQMCKTRPGCPVASGGDCLSCKPYSLKCNVLPLSYKGLATEAAAFAGFTFLLL